jgi:hypothetical protein
MIHFNQSLSRLLLLLHVKLFFYLLMSSELVSEGIEVKFLARVRDVSLLHGIQIATGSQSPMHGWGGYFPGVKQLEHEAEHSCPSSAEVKNEWDSAFASALHVIVLN